MTSSKLVVRLLGFVFLFIYFTPLQLNAQRADQTQQYGSVSIINWPHSAYEQVATDSLLNAAEVVPLINELNVGYSYGIDDDVPTFSYTVTWTPGEFVYLDGEQVAFDALQGDVLIESIVLQAEVVVDGAPATLLTLAHDSLMSQASPGYVAVELGSLDWATFFADTDAPTARSYFEKGFELGDVRIAEIAFVHFEDMGLVSANEPAAGRQPVRRTVYRPNISIWIDFPFYGGRPFPRRIAGADTRATASRGSNVGRGDRSGSSTRRTTDRGSRADNDADEEKGGILSGRKNKSDDDDEEEDEGDLMPAAIAGVAAVAAVAVVGGTVGYFGNSSHTPIGLMTGYVHPSGGVLLQVAVNGAVLERSKTETEYFLGRVVGFVDTFNAPIQPAFGFGLLVSQAENNVDYDPSFPLGLAGNFGSTILMAGYDVLNGGVDFGIAFNFRAK